MTGPRGEGTTPRQGEAVDQAVEQDVERLRTELGDTVEELVHRVDVPQRLREKRAEATERVQAQVAHAREVVAEKAPAVEDAVRQRPLVVGGVIAALLLLFLRSKRRKRARRKEDADGTR